MSLRFKVASKVIITVVLLSSLNALAEESSQRRYAAKLLEHFGYSHAIFEPQKRSKHFAAEFMYYYPCKNKEIVSKNLNAFMEDRFSNILIKNNFIDLFVESFTEKDLENLLNFIDLPPKEPKILIQLMDLTWQKFANTVEEDPKWFFEYSPKNQSTIDDFLKTNTGKKIKERLPSVLLESRELRNQYLKSFLTEDEIGAYVKGALDSNEECKKNFPHS